ncbi:MAG: MerR family transcriptional regulator [Desulfurivibrionaceae bacterium]
MDQQPTANKDLLQIGEISRRAGVTPRTVRYYMEEGFIKPSERSPGGFYLFAPETADTVYFVQQLKDLGMNLREIKTLFAARKEKNTGHEAYQVVQDHLEQEKVLLEEKIRACRQLQEDIEQAIELVSGCDGCRQKPDRRNCLNCRVVSTRNKLPMAFQAIL